MSKLSKDMHSLAVNYVLDQSFQTKLMKVKKAPIILVLMGAFSQISN